MTSGQVQYLQDHSGLSGKGPVSSALDTLRLALGTWVSCAQRDLGAVLTLVPACKEPDASIALGLQMNLDPGNWCGHGQGQSHHPGCRQGLTPSCIS